MKVVRIRDMSDDDEPIPESTLNPETEEGPDEAAEEPAKPIAVARA